MKVTPDRITDYKAPSAEEAPSPEDREASAVSTIRGRFPGNDKGTVGRPAPGL
ncbi:hypothetical protein ECP02999172_5209 [Escherichia coli P0299917.2]|nr:hypothetical protein ECP02999172_5209 [Escherichia coli P0299917.2]